MVEKCLKRQKSLRREHGIVSPMSPRSPCDTEPRRLATAELSGKWGDLFCAPGCYIDFCGPSARGFAIPFAAVLGQFGPRSNYLYLYANSLLSNYIYMSCKSSKKKLLSEWEFVVSCPDGSFAPVDFFQHLVDHRFRSI